MQRSVVIFVKEPRPGRVKTRLGAALGMTAAAWWFRHQSSRLIRGLACDPRWHLALAVSPDWEGLASRVWPGEVLRFPQGRGNLGARMARAFRAMPPGPVIIVGADIPALGPAHVAEGFRLLGSHDAVLGPAEDGGFWMIGLKRGAKALPAGLLKGVRWSSPEALEDTVASLVPLRVAFGPTLADVDEPDILGAAARR